MAMIARQKGSAPPAFAVRELALGWVVVDANRRAVSRVFNSYHGACRHCSLRNERAGNVDRPCMCCGTVFSSEGAHKRMCSSCRTGNTVTPFNNDLSAVR
jgi:hypothetical protein